MLDVFSKQPKFSQKSPSPIRLRSDKNAMEVFLSLNIYKPKTKNLD